MFNASVFTATLTAHGEPHDVIGFDDARIELDRLAVAEWAAAQDEYTPTRNDRRIAATAAQG